MRKPPRCQPVCFHPTMGMFIDDNKSYLSSLSTVLDLADINHKMIMNPKQSMPLLEENVKNYCWLNMCLERPEIDDIYDRLRSNVVSLRINKLLDIALKKDRFNEIACVWFDYQMPGLTGIDCMEKLHHLPFKLGLLSGIADNTDALEYFNEQTLDIYINKKQADSTKSIMKYLKQAEWAYFIEPSFTMIKSDERLSKVLTNDSFINKLNKIQKEHSIVEGYLIDPYGSFALFDAQAKALIVAAIHDDEIEAFYQMALMADKKPDEDVLNLIKQRKAFPFFYGHDISDIEPKDWGSYLVPATKIQGSNILYSVIDDVEKYGIDTNRITSYAEFLSNQDPFEFT